METEVKLSPLKYENQISSMGITGPSAHLLGITGPSAQLLGISIGTKNNILHHVACLLDTEVQPKFISKEIVPVVGYQKYLKNRNLRLYPRRKTNRKPRVRPRYTSNLAIYLQVYCLLYWKTWLSMCFQVQPSSTSTYLQTTRRKGGSCP